MKKKLGSNEIKALQEKLKEKQDILQNIGAYVEVEIKEILEQALEKKQDPIERVKMDLACHELDYFTAEKGFFELEARLEKSLQLRKIGKEHYTLEKSRLNESRKALDKELEERIRELGGVSESDLFERYKQEVAKYITSKLNTEIGEIESKLGIAADKERVDKNNTEEKKGVKISETTEYHEIPTRGMIFAGEAFGQVAEQLVQISDKELLERYKTQVFLPRWKSEFKSTYIEQKLQLEYNAVYKDIIEYVEDLIIVNNKYLKNKNSLADDEAEYLLKGLETLQNVGFSDPAEAMKKFSKESIVLKILESEIDIEKEAEQRAREAIRDGAYKKSFKEHLNQLGKDGLKLQFEEKLFFEAINALGYNNRVPSETLRDAFKELKEEQKRKESIEGKREVSELPTEIQTAKVGSDVLEKENAPLNMTLESLTFTRETAALPQKAEVHQREVPSQPVEAQTREVSSRGSRIKDIIGQFEKQTTEEEKTIKKDTDYRQQVKRQRQEKSTKPFRSH